MAENDIARIAAQADLPAIASNFTAVKPKGREYVATCVFHSPDVNPSLTIFQKGGKWQFKCFSCGEGGDAIDWIEKLEGVDTATACKRLNGDSNWEPKFKAPPKSAPLPDRITSKPPADAGRPYAYMRHIGAPVKEWDYKDADGAFLGCVARYEPDGGKEFRCWTWGTRDSKPPSWDCGHWSGKRPLYGLDQLAARPSAPVLIVEGEKAADAAAKILPGYVVVCWPGGAGAWHKADWEPVKGRSALIWPDNDEPGLRAGDEIAKLISDPRGIACRVRLVNPRGEAEGWDIADWQGTQEELIAWAKARASDYHHIVERQHGLPDDLPPIEAYTDQPPSGDSQIVVPQTKDLLSGVIFRSMADVEAKPISWLWPGRIAKGKVSMIVGNPGLGKSQVCASIASIVSNGQKWPVDGLYCKSGSVVILSAEDDAEDTIRPRLEAAGANLSKIYILDAIRVEREEGDGKRGFDLSVDIAKLGALLFDLEDAALVIIDPITAYLGEADSHKNAEVRALLAPLSEMASLQRVAVVAVSHLTKSSGMEALLRVQGSIGFAAAARAVWGVAKDKENPSRRLFMPLKNNLGTDVNGFAYSVEGMRLPESDIDTSRVLWESQAVTMTADEVFGREESSFDDRSDLVDAKNYLRSLLADGPVPVKAIEDDAKGAGHSWATLRRAQKEMGITSYRGDGMGARGKWYWRLEQQSE